MESIQTKKIELEKIGTIYSDGVLYLVLYVLINKRPETYFIPTISLNGSTIPNAFVFRFLVFKPENDDREYIHKFERFYDQTLFFMLGREYTFEINTLCIVRPKEYCSLIDIILMYLKSVHSELYLKRVFSERMLKQFPSSYDEKKNVGLSDMLKQFASSYAEKNVGLSDMTMTKQKSFMGNIMSNLMMRHAFKKAKLFERGAINNEIFGMLKLN